MNTKTPPWKKKNLTKGTSKTKLTPEQIEEAKARAKKAGRPYPNLVDNMAVVREANKKIKAGAARSRTEDDFPETE